MYAKNGYGNTLTVDALVTQLLILHYFKNLNLKNCNGPDTAERLSSELPCCHIMQTLILEQNRNLFILNYVTK